MLPKCFSKLPSLKRLLRHLACTIYQFQRLAFSTYTRFHSYKLPKLSTLPVLVCLNIHYFSELLDFSVFTCLHMVFKVSKNNYNKERFFIRSKVLLESNSKPDLHHAFSLNRFANVMQELKIPNFSYQ